jgi:SAM-dependent methyltransferase
VLVGDVWSVGSAYESYVGRWSRLVAPGFLSWLGVPERRRWIDVGCGTGTLAEAILDHARPALVLGIDRSRGFVGPARVRSGARASFLVGDAQALPVTSGGFDAVVSGLVLNFVPRPSTMLAEMSRAGRPGCTIGLYVWDYAAGMQLVRSFWDAAKALDPAAGALDEAARFPICEPARLEALFAAAGLEGVASRAIDVSTSFRDFDDYWSPFLGGQGPAPAYATSLSEERRGALRERLRGTLPRAADGSIPLRARAWAVRGTSAGERLAR